VKGGGSEETGDDERRREAAALGHEPEELVSSRGRSRRAARLRADGTSKGGQKLGGKQIDKSDRGSAGSERQKLTPAGPAFFKPDSFL